jgi:hypothetical protein
VFWFVQDEWSVQDTTAHHGESGIVMKVDVEDVMSVKVVAKDYQVVYVCMPRYLLLLFFLM